MAQKVTVPFQGRTAQGESVAVVRSPQEGQEYELADGTTLRVRMLLLDAVRLDEEKDAFGLPVYVLKMQNVIDVRKKG
jgi:hypothetical protein